MDERTAKATKTAVTVGGLLVVLVLVGTIIFGSFYTVSEQEQAIVVQFGKAIDVQKAGLHFKIPFIQSVIPVSMVTKSMELGYRVIDGQYEDVESEAFMITKDFNFVMIDFFIEYKVTDPIKYRFKAVNSDELLRNALQAEARNVVSSYDVDDVLTVAKTEIQSKIKEETLLRLDQYDIGINVTNVTIQDAAPPTEEVRSAFKDVENAKQEKETEINTAEREYNEKIPSARANADKISKEAEGIKLARINEAKGQVARFENMFNEYIKNPAITKTRMYLEALEQVMPGVKVYVDSGNGALKLLNLE